MLYIMRHGKTDWNARHKLQGKTNIPLNQEGMGMAMRAAKEYADIPFDVCYSSPLSRARKTAELFLQGRSVPIISDERLEEMGFGVCEGTENYFHDSNCPLYEMFHHPEKYIIPVENGESMQSLYSRTGEFLNDVVNPLLAQEKDILIVGHGVMNSCIICQVRNLPVEKLWSVGIENCKLIRLL